VNCIDGVRTAHGMLAPSERIAEASTVRFVASVVTVPITAPEAASRVKRRPLYSTAVNAELSYPAHCQPYTLAK
jgi:hypothetical protein